MPFESLQSLLAWNPPNIRQFVGSSILLQETKLCIFGAPKSFKSIIAQQLGFCIASGTDWLGFPTAKGVVAYLQSEIPKHALQGRVLKMARNAVIPNNQYVFDTNFRFKLDRPSDITALEMQLDKVKPQVLILDPWYKMLSHEDNNAYLSTQDTLDRLIAKYKMAIIMIHHDTVPNMDPAGSPLTQFHPRGPRTTEGWFDSIIQVDGDVQTDSRTLRFELRHALSLIFPFNVVLDRNRLWLDRAP